MLCRACLAAQQNTHVVTSDMRDMHVVMCVTGLTRVQRHRNSVDWGGHVHLTFW